ncbi:fumarylacetoacetate hydrolase family protein [Rubellimicrobium rubrum]|uniref:Fumarylacetoacetate hydrolase family protein n=1 Tax=Rubellimicrobium rubrum TaxID=2585369 RepID=A0A5C4MVT1_9RHOB|nr:fumarylacetoacetate hydrolase family protein [Rubellimicrobium rubrum]TNC47978.1 fumarylacetoacetate hydrolase family protein [Rubellimicrobium rubrum]
MTHAFPPRLLPVLPVTGSDLVYPVARIFCVGRNYEAHAAEMGNQVDREAPFWFTKSAFALIPSDGILPYPPGTQDLHHEVELVLALGEGGDVWGFGVGLDMTRRDLQAKAKAAGKPWDTAKDFEGSAIVGPLVRGRPDPQAVLALTVNGVTRQEAPLSQMVHGIDALLGHVRGLYSPGPGDLIMTGTPAGVGPVVPGDRLEGMLDGVPPVTLRIA